MVSDIMFCVAEVIAVAIMIVRFAELNVENKWYSHWILVLEFLGAVAVAYFFLLLYRIFNGI